MIFSKRELDQIARRAAPKIVERLLAAEKELRDVRARMIKIENFAADFMNMPRDNKGGSHAAGRS